MSNIKNALIVVAFVLTVGYGAFSYFMYPEQYSDIDRYQLMMALNAGSDIALEYYEDRYTSRDVYLFDGEISFSLFVKKHKVEFPSAVYDHYRDSGLTLNDYVKWWKTVPHE